MKAIGQAEVGAAKGNMVSDADIGLAGPASGRTGVALIALSAPLIALANADIASHGLVGINTGAGAGAGGSIQAKGLNRGVEEAGGGGAQGNGQLHPRRAVSGLS